MDRKHARGDLLVPHTATILRERGLVHRALSKIPWRTVTEQRERKLSVLHYSYPSDGLASMFSCRKILVRWSAQLNGKRPHDILRKLKVFIKPLQHHAMKNGIKMRKYVFVDRTHRSYICGSVRSTSFENTSKRRKRHPLIQQS